MLRPENLGASYLYYNSELNNGDRCLCIANKEYINPLYRLRGTNEPVSVVVRLLDRDQLNILGLHRLSNGAGEFLPTILVVNKAGIERAAMIIPRELIDFLDHVDGVNREEVRNNAGRALLSWMGVIGNE